MNHQKECVRINHSTRIKITRNRYCDFSHPEQSESTIRVDMLNDIVVDVSNSLGKMIIFDEL